MVQSRAQILGICAYQCCTVVTDAVSTAGARPWCNSRQVDIEGKQYGL